MFLSLVETDTMKKNNTVQFYRSVITPDKDYFLLLLLASYGAFYLWLMQYRRTFRPHCAAYFVTLAYIFCCETNMLMMLSMFSIDTVSNFFPFKFFVLILKYIIQQVSVLMKLVQVIILVLLLYVQQSLMKIRMPFCIPLVSEIQNS